MDEEGCVAAVHRSHRNVTGFRETAEQAGKYVALKKKPNRTPEEELELFMHDNQFGNLTYDDATERAGKLEGLTEDQQAEIDQILIDLEVIHHVPEKGQDAPTEEKAVAGQHYYEMQQEGRIPSVKMNIIFNYYQLDYAESVKDPELFESCLAVLKRNFGGNPRARDFLQKLDERLEALREDSD